MRRLALPGLAALLAGALVALLVFGVLQASESTSLDEAVAKGKQPVAHDAKLPLLEGRGTKTLADYRGHYLVVNFFASWCEPCREEAPLLNDIERAVARDGGTVLGVAWNDTVEDAREFVRDTHLAYPIVRDVDGKFGRAYGIRGMPETFVVDPRGRIVALKRSQITRGWVTGTLDPLLNTRAQ
jgi:cytochrome c biogenesis protein CcmG, thiol:disulfide interchange protein DsbE